MLDKSEYSIKNIELADTGELEISLAAGNMPVVSAISDRMSMQRPFEGLKITVCSHVTKETAVACIGLKAGGAKVQLVAATITSTKDTVAAALVAHHDIAVMGNTGFSADEFLAARMKMFDFAPDLILDDSAEALPLVYDRCPEFAQKIIGSAEQTTAGVAKVEVLEKLGMLKNPVVAVNSSKIKCLFDNVYGVGQSMVDGILRTTGMLLAGRTIVLLGYGNVGRGAAMRLKGMGANVIICEIDPLKALDAHLSGYQVMSLQEAAKLGDMLITVTGSKDIIPIDEILRLKNGAILSNCGSGKSEIDVSGLKEHAVKIERVRPHMERYTLDNGKCVYLLSEGRVNNLVAAEGNPSEIMDFTFSAIMLAAEYLVQKRGTLNNAIYVMPNDIDNKIARIKLNEYEIRLNKPTQKQKEYEARWLKE